MTTKELEFLEQIINSKHLLLDNLNYKRIKNRIKNLKSENGK